MKKTRRLLLLASLVLLAPLVASQSPQAPTPRSVTDVAAYRVATFDSGFGGYFTAKAIEQQARGLSADGYGPFLVAHYGDTTNIPYGEKTPEEIAAFASAGILTALRDGARDVYVACNTASTQIDRIRTILRRENTAYPGRVYSVIDVSVREVMKTVSAKLRDHDQVIVAILATPATVKSETYPRFLATALNTPFVPGRFEKLTQPRWMTAKAPTIDSFAYQATLALGRKKRVIVYQLAPANWVEMIENGAPEAEKREAVRRDLEMLLGRTNEAARFDLVGEFCTHFPVFDAMIREEMQRLGKTAPETPYIVQGPLMGELFRAQFLQRKPRKARGRYPLPQRQPST